MVSWGSVDNWGSMDSVGNWSVDSMGNTMWGNRVEWDDSILTNWDWSVGSDGGLDLRKSLGVVSLDGDTMCGSKSLALAQGSDLTMSGGDGLVRGLSSNNSVVNWSMDSMDGVDWGMTHQDWTSGGSCGVSLQGSD